MGPRAARRAGAVSQPFDVLPGPVGVYPKGSLFGLATNGGTGSIYLINPNDGSSTQIGSSFGLTVSSGYDIDFDPTLRSQLPALKFSP